MLHICVSGSGQLWFRYRLFVYSAPSHYLNECGVIVKWTLTINVSEILLKYKTFHLWKCVWRYRLQNGSHLFKVSHGCVITPLIFMYMQLAIYSINSMHSQFISAGKKSRSSLFYWSLVICHERSSNYSPLGVWLRSQKCIIFDISQRWDPPNLRWQWYPFLNILHNQQSKSTATV